MTLLKKIHYQKCSEFVSKQVAVNTKTIVDRTKRQHAFHFQSLSMVVTQYANFSVTMVCWLTTYHGVCYIHTYCYNRHGCHKCVVP